MIFRALMKLKMSFPTLPRNESWSRGWAITSFRVAPGLVGVVCPVPVSERRAEEL